MPRQGVEINAPLLREICKIREYTHQRLADAVDVDVRTLRGWLGEEYSPEPDKFDNLCKALNVTAEDLKMSSMEAQDRGRHAIVLNYYMRAYLDTVDANEYKDIQRIERDLQDAAVIDTSADEVKAGKVTVYGAEEPPRTGESDAVKSDDESSEGDNG